MNKYEKAWEICRKHAFTDIIEYYCIDFEEFVDELQDISYEEISRVLVTLVEQEM